MPPRSTRIVLIEEDHSPIVLARLPSTLVNGGGDNRSWSSCAGAAFRSLPWSLILVTLAQVAVLYTFDRELAFRLSLRNNDITSVHEESSSSFVEESAGREDVGTVASVPLAVAVDGEQLGHGGADQQLSEVRGRNGIESYGGLFAIR